ncbi:apolipoprotein N-acyltransferase [Halopseudomonas litoralis]|uniref:Apolipoprotein N-acyltransferase n=1 Tax=Halopseudomonas litoralis TaxID=797277 RepID=A0A1H1V103_9GAMM|nr:apolipoprotein N-acyltransferase [Halopseudomonas litoralis]SDS78353.1 apolipoprotein N-acyltransferase [Halopseudomonas litoralis]
MPYTTPDFLAADIRSERLHESLARTLLRLSLAGLSGFLLCVPWLSANLYWVGWLAWVPLLFALRDVRPLSALLLGWFAGTLCFAGGSYWLAEFMVNLKQISPLLSTVLASLFWCYLGLVIGLGCMIYRWLAARLCDWELLLFPSVMVSVMAAYPMLFKTHFADGQTSFLPALQAIEFTGAPGLDAMMMLFSMLVFHLLAPQKHFQARFSRAISCLAWALLIGWLGYGYTSLHQWDRRMQQWDTRQIGLVQPNDAITLGIPKPAIGFSREYPPELASTERLIAAGAQWVAWPEARYKGYFDNYSVRARYAQTVAEQGVPLIFHDVERRWQDAQRVSFNTVAMLDGQGELAAQYRKMLRMPFGEYLPEPWSWPLLKPVTDWVFGEFLRPLGAGDEHVIFDMGGMRVVPKVCYEAAFPGFVAEAVNTDGAGKMLLFLSQDNWFGETSQPFQHANMSILRGVENRVPMAHLINNGPSVVTAPNGRRLANSAAFNRAELLAAVPFDEAAGGSFYSRHPQLFLNMTQGLAAMLIGLALWRGRPAVRRRARRYSRKTRPTGN